MGKLLRKVTGRAVGRYRAMGIQMVISLSFTAVAIVGMVFMGMSLFLRFSTTTYELMEDNSQRVLAQVNMNLDGYLRRMMRVSDTLYYRIIKNTDLEEGSLESGMSLLYEENRESIVSIAVFDEKGRLVSAAPLSELKPDAELRDSGWFQAAIKKMENFHFSTPHVQNLFQEQDARYRWVVSLSSQVQLTRGGATETGVLLVDMSFGGIEQICRDVQLSNGGYLYLIDGSGELIYHPRQQLISAGLLEENNRAAAGYSDGSHRESFQGRERQVTVKTVGYTGWKLVGVVPMEDLEADSHQMVLFGLSLLLFSIFLMAFLNFRISAHISDPIRRLEQSIKELEAGRDNVEIEERGCYEVQHLSRSIRSMVSTMHHLMDDIVQQEAQKRRSELEVLQSQINPHFLYNALEAIRTDALLANCPDIAETTEALATFFRYTISNVQEYVTFSDELDNAENYFTIQRCRFGDKISLELELENERLLEVRMPKLILQPLVENAVSHGLEGKLGHGTVRIIVENSDRTFFLRVRDDGVGMPDEQVERLNAQFGGVGGADMTQPCGGIALRNVNSRIRLMFGEDYGLHLFSAAGVGTECCVTLPLRFREA